MSTEIIATDEFLPTRDSALAEAHRVLTICNACRYCEGLCATFQSMTRRRTFAEVDMEYLANLCHNCTACYHDCQYAAPHEFDVNVPTALAALRGASYEHYAWPQPLARAFQRNGLVVSLGVALSLAIVLVAVLLLQDSSVLFGTHTGPGAFYTVIGHGVMVAVAGITFGFSVLALTVGGVRFWRSHAREAAQGLPGAAPQVRLGLRALWRALVAAGTLRYLDGGHGEGCSTTATQHSNARRYYHQATLWGFVLCFASTSVATIYDYVFGWQAPYGIFSLPVVLGTVGGIALALGCVGLALVKRQSDPRPQLLRQYGMDYAFLALLFAVSVTGLALLVLRATPAMGMLLAVHLGVVLALFVCLPYCKFVHSIYRFVALLRFGAETA